MRFSGKVAVVTGGASGIGRAVTEGLLREGASIVVLDVNYEAIRETLSSVSTDRVLGIAADVTDEKQIGEAMLKVCSTHGHLDVLCNAAGVVGPRGSVEELDVTQWDRIVRIDLASIYLTVRAALPMMKRSGAGSIVNIASIAALRGTATVNVAYAAAKGGVVSLTQQLAADLASQGIRVNSVSPGFVATPMNLDMRSAGLDRLWTGRIPLRRYARPEEMAEVVLFLASEQASYVTGANLIADGGLSAVLSPDVVPLADTAKSSIAQKVADGI